jgi:acyl-CoA synthetase (AMP-forming)/AMP-acid ligase II/acyl carrier protein
MVERTNTLPHLLQSTAEKFPNAFALTAPGRKPCTYRQLFDQIQTASEGLAGMGYGRRDRLAIVLPNGPEMAAAFLAVASTGTAAPLNPNYGAVEFEFYLSDLNARALIVAEGEPTEARSVADDLGIPIIELAHDPFDPAGFINWRGRDGLEPQRTDSVQASDTALVLHTSGTTSRPKIVPLKQDNLTRSARNICDWLALTPEDRCLNVMPLFHVHGLMAALLASLVAGASVVCTEGFLAPRFFEWMGAENPTWYTAVPTMHQGILNRAGRHADVLEQVQLRFIRSCSASLPPRVMHELEETFQAPVVEAYGMTEGTHQICCNPLPPRTRKPGSVGLPTGTQVCILDDAGCQLDVGEVGEIAIQGSTITQGYESNPQANEQAFTDGWFRTGDQGYLDQDGYLFITGRTKEIINRGGEKIAPREVEEALLDHPQVIQAVVFPSPDPMLGETVAAAVILQPESRLDERELRRFASLKLTPFKVPSQIIFVDEVPKGPTGKLQRIGLAQRLGLGAEADTAVTEMQEYVEPSTPIEEKLASIWSEVLVLEEVGVKSSFLSLGGDSMLAAQIVSRVREAFEVDVSLMDFFDTPSIEDMAALLSTRIEDSGKPGS